MNWIYRVPVNKGYSSKRFYMFRYAKLLRKLGYTCADTGDTFADVSTIVICSVPKNTELEYNSGDIIYFMTDSDLGAFDYAGISYKIVPDAYKSTCVNYTVTTEDKGNVKLHREVDANIKKVIFNNPATIVFWEDGTKTVVKCQDGEKFDQEKGIALCYMKKICGNTGNFNEVFKEWIKPKSTTVYDEQHPEFGIQDIPPKNKKVLPSGRYRIKTAELGVIDRYLIDNKLTYGQIAKDTKLSTKTIKRVLHGQPMSSYTKYCLTNYFDFPIGFTRYAED